MYPFPVTVLDDYLPDELALGAWAEFPDPDDERWHTFDSEHEHGKQQLDSDVLGTFPRVSEALGVLSSPGFIRTLSEVSGIDDLVPDVLGGGMHQTRRGGFLNMHVDSATDFREQAMYRRLNVLLYLNDDWTQRAGGALVLASRGSTRWSAFSVVEPTWNRLVVFETSGETWHGHPHPWQRVTPRRSLAIYYYTLDAPPDFDPERRTTFTAERPL